ncbi:MAG: putative ABC transporter permease [Eggerthellaceae bacterium]|nr:putative ABC transporter permease [Eggerthellaceae bacterium]
MRDESSAGMPTVVRAACVGVILFAVFACAGWIYETAENVFTFGGVYLRASLMLPWCPIYGIGGLVIVCVMEPVRKRLARRVPLAAQVAVVCIGIYALTALVELAGSYVCEALMGYVPWDYSGAWLNFDGRIAPAYTLRFVVLGLVALYGVYPIVTKWVGRHGRAAVVVAVALVCLFVIDNVLEAAGVWARAKDALVPFGINYW